MSFPRFRIRTLMFAIATIAVVLAADKMRRLRLYYLKNAEVHATGLEYYQSTLKFYEDGPSRPFQFRNSYAKTNELNDMYRQSQEDYEDATKKYKMITERFKQNIIYHAAMKRKYEYAAAHPWFPLSPDPEGPVR